MNTGLLDEIEWAPWVLHPKYGSGFDDLLDQEWGALENWLPGFHGHLVGEICDYSCVIPRFRSVWHFRELLDELEYYGHEPVNTWQQHCFAADLGQWFEVFSDITPQSWRGVERIPAGCDGPFIVKGATNSIRGLWGTHCYAADRERLGSVVVNVVSDSLVGRQETYIRQYVPLDCLVQMVNGMPVGQEYRIFFLDGAELARGFYWVNMLPDLDAMGLSDAVDTDMIPDGFVKDVGRRLEGRVRLAAVDVARTAGGEWIVVELNDGAQSGLCGVDANVFYRNLAQRI